jgi:radical SAM superfamily enzyme YgiQ (UPF0313 family)
MKVLLVQPPFAQLNAPYPAIHYLATFLRSRGATVRAVDHSIELYRAIFSRGGLAPIFEAARNALEGFDRAEEADEATRSQLERYLSCEELYLGWVGGLVDFLSGGDPAFAHRLSTAVEFPRGMRAEAFLEARGGRIETHEARGLATAMLEDLGDLVSYAYDPSFSTVRYGERLAASASSFASIRSSLEASPLLESHYRPLLSAEWKREAPDCLLVTIPFPGCLLGALACASSFREAFGKDGRIIFGGGYVSTELRGLRDGGIFDFCDYLSFDSGYGSIASILALDGGASRESLYETMYRGEDGRPVAAGFAEGDEASSEPDLRRVTRCDDDAMRELDSRATVATVPDYADADFGRYLQVVDSDNPMHRLWSDSPWLKYALAHGCYWRRCSFCDTELDYVARYAPTEPGRLLEAADAASARTGLYGIHFVDEAMPMSALLAFAKANRARAKAGKKPFHFWGNVRFDSSWTEDRCEYLSASGLVAVSGGIEIATEGGLEMTDKGFDLAGLARTLVAMKRSGLLVHAYLIYGFPGQSRSDIVDSAEVCRQLFAAGLVDSAFWHRFVLTRHSRMNAERREGKRPELEALDRDWDFANNDLGFVGERAFDEFDAPLAATLEAWMAGQGLERDAEGALEEAGLHAPHRGLRHGMSRGAGHSAGRDVSAAGGLIEGLVAAAELALEEAKAGGEGTAHWIAGLPLVRAPGSGETALAWTYRGEARELLLPAASVEGAAKLLAALAGSPEGRPASAFLAELASLPGLAEGGIAELRGSGLAVV